MVTKGCIAGGHTKYKKTNKITINYYNYDY